MMQLIDPRNGIVHQHDGIREASLFTACERGRIEATRAAFTRVIGATVTCLWCAVGTRTNDYRGR